MGTEVPLFSGDDSFQSVFHVAADREQRNEDGTCQRLELWTQNIGFRFPGTDSLEADFKLIFGVGEVTAQKLRNDGFQTLHDLTRHPRWSRAAADVLRLIEARNYERLAAYGASDLQLLSFFDPRQIKFIDIETVGLYYVNPVFLVGVLRFEEDRGIVSQYLARDYSEEKALLREVLDELRQTALIASFNGRSFDIPYLRGRMRYHQLRDMDRLVHVDLLRTARKNYRDALPNCRLVTIERHLLSEERMGDLPGSQVADYYHQFVETGDRSLIAAILKHNARDLLSMAKILGIMTDGLGTL
jgi:uncharacterized protein YprB with RNaseH-like and TPR domain